jgi:hypothetical protein
MNANEENYFKVDTSLICNLGDSWSCAHWRSSVVYS